MLHFQLPEKLAQRRAVVAAQTIDGVEHRIEQAGFDVADIDAGLAITSFWPLPAALRSSRNPAPILLITSLLRMCFLLMVVAYFRIVGRFRCVGCFRLNGRREKFM